MSAMRVDDIARGNTESWVTKRNAVDHNSATQDLGVDDDLGEHRFMGFGEPPPPAPRIHSEGLLQTDITAKFTDASSGLFAP